MHFNEISDEEWLLLAPVLADPPLIHRQRGRPRAAVRAVANAVLWVLTTGDPWSTLPSHYPSVPTCRHRFEAWRSSGALAQMYRILSSSGRKFRCGPQLTLERRNAVTRGIDRQTRDEGFRRVFWRDQASWQTSRETWQSSQTADIFKDLARDLPHPANSEHAVPERIEPRAPVTHLPAIQRVASPWMGLASKGRTESDPRGYVIYIAADRLANAHFRGWAEIVRDDRRVARSGLIGPSFKNCETAQQYALEWAWRWIDEESGEDGNAAELDNDVRQQKTRAG
ncbi:transposase [Paraburkholderia sp. BL6665CI2N2]|uniref:transposase n=1 Tax=Paraburkholderia sp. BL6665CI2N2 TaxID=1938806 RepID=UPI0010F2C644|nr:transposase [Paraburkholderia sp. BL6665CI2N2]TDY22925.1 transposase [Paraburkholderia sp. BL6665CI2N2]